ncbi:MAG: hypothetical protein M1832_002431 [Thelocarpon impressellum]|nr:MAG: hypothetical protein M1832_002431 [Thelocarpon impressellum]
MLDSFEVLTTSGVVLWSRSYAPVSKSVIDSLITDVFIEERITPGAASEDASAANSPPYRKDKYTLKWTTAKDLKIIFVAVYQSLLHISWIDKLLDNVKTIFVDLYRDQLKRPHTSIVDCPFDDYFDQQLGELETTAITSHTGRTSRRARKSATNSTHASSGEDSGGKKQKNAKAGSKKMRRWDADGLADEDDEVPLDYSAPTNGTSAQESQGARPGTVDPVDHASWGRKTGNGEFVLKDLDDKVHSILSSANAKASGDGATQGVVGSSLGAIGGLFKNVIGGKVLTKEDLEKPMKGMEEHLLKKNVAREAAVRLCEGVEKSLVGVKTGSFQSIETTMRSAMESSLRKILTPTTSLDLLRSIDSVNHPSTMSLQKARPYVISIVGVNGVGKSTNLSKICFFLLQNKHKVLIAACDTFRSGAVEQLRVHAQNLKELGEREGAMVELYEKGYGKDAGNIARDAVAYAAEKSFSVVLIDTAGRRHNDSRLMSSLEKFAKLAKPDKILMVGEALVGSDSVQQARNFDAAFGQGRHLDGFIISKCDTVGDMVGTLVSMVHATATVQAAILSATSNVLAQALAAFREGSPPYIDFIRVLHFILFAALSCPPNYMWQRFLEESFPQWTDAGQSPREGVEKGSNGARRLNLGNTAKKVALDQTLGAAVNTVLFIAVMGSLKGADMQEVVRLIRRVSCWDESKLVSTD